MSELAPVIDIRTRRHVAYLHAVDTSPDETAAMQRDRLWTELERAERLVEHYRRKLGLLAVENGTDETV